MLNLNAIIVEKSRPQQSRPNSPSSSSDESGGDNAERKGRVVIQNVSDDEEENPDLGMISFDNKFLKAYLKWIRP